MNHCPICKSRKIGKINRGRYFCGECCHEWTFDEGQVTVYAIDMDGSLSRLRVKNSLNQMSNLQRNAG